MGSSLNKGYFSNFMESFFETYSELQCMIDCFLRSAPSLPIVARLTMKTQKLPVRYNAEELSLIVSPLPLDAHRRVSRLMLKTKTPCEVQCRGALNENLTIAS